MNTDRLRLYNERMEVLRRKFGLNHLELMDIIFRDVGKELGFEPPPPEPVAPGYPKSPSSTVEKMIRPGRHNQRRYFGE